MIFRVLALLLPLWLTIAPAQAYPKLCLSIYGAVRAAMGHRAPPAAPQSEPASYDLSNLFAEPIKKSGVEIETPTSSESLALVQPKEWSVAKILGGLPAPQWLLAGEGIRTPRNLDDLKWDHLTTEGRIRLIAYAQNLSLSSPDWRSNLLLETRNSVGVNLREPLCIFGQHLPAGASRLKLLPFLERDVQNRSPEDAVNFGGIELRLRLDLSAGDAAREAMKFNEVVGLPKKHLHVHLIKKRPLFITPWFGLRNTELLRRSNLLAEMIAIADINAVIRQSMSGGESVILFDSLKAKDLSVSLHYWLGNVLTNLVEQSNYRARLELGRFGAPFVALRDGTGSYGDPSLWGFEYRSYAKGSDDAKMQRILNQMDRLMESDPTPPLWNGLKLWFEKNKLHESFNAQGAAGLYEKFWYNDHKLSQGLYDPHEQRYYLSALNREAETGMSYDDFIEKNRKIQMLWYAWENDPIFLDHPELIPHILETQRAALDQIFDHKKNVHKTVKAWMIESGVYQRVVESLGLDWDTIKPQETQKKSESK